MASNGAREEYDYVAIEKKAAAINSEPEDFGRTGASVENPYVFEP